MRTLTLKRGEDRRLRAGHLWIFSNEINTAKTPLTDFAPGEEATVTDYHGSVLGSACVNPSSLICARLYSRNGGEALGAELLGKRLHQALNLRQKFFSAPFYRLVHGEGDALPGLIIDRFGSHCTIQVGTAGMEAKKDLLQESIETLIHPDSIFWDNSIASRALEQLPQECVAQGHLPEELEIPENDCLFAVPTCGGQKTGWYYDQRNNRGYMSKLTRLTDSGDILDAFSYAGGFGVTAAHAGAKSVTFVDASEHALRYAQRNLEKNAPTCACETIQADAFDSLQKLRDSGRKFDIVSIDPPAFIKRRRDMKEGIQAYRRLNTLACSLVRDDGYLVTSSCSQHFSLEDLRSAAALAAARQHLLPRLIYTGFQGPDHPVHCSMPETAYLKCLVLQLGH